MESHRRHSTRAAAASPPLPPRSQPLPTSPASPLLPRPDAMARSPAAPTATPMSPAAPNPTPRSPAASTPTPRAPDASIPTPRWPPPPTSTPKSSAADLEEHKGTSELLRAIKIEKANGPDLEEHKCASEPHMEPPKCKKRKPSRQSSGELHGEHQETNKVVMKPSTSKKKRKASEEMCTNPPAPPLGPLAVDMDKQAPPLKKKRLNKVNISLPIDKNKQPSLSKKVVRSPVLNNVVVSFLPRKEKKAKSLESSPSQPSLLALSPNVANLGSSRRRKLKSKIWNEVEPIYVDGILAQGRCTYCSQLFHASKKSGTSHIGKHLVVCEEKAKMDGMVAKIRTDSAIDPEWKFDPGRARRALVKLIVLHELPFSFVEYPGFRSFVKTLNPWFNVVSRETIKQDCIAAYDRHKKEIQAFFSNLSSRVSLTGDMWTSNQKLGYLCITAHFIDDSWTLQNKIIRFCLLETPHNAHNIFDMVQKSLRDWNIEDKIFSFTLDNAPVNDSMVRHLRKNLVDRYLVHHNGKLLHVRCAAHVLNLVVQDGLKAMASVVDRIRESVMYVKSSQGRMEKFDEMIAQVGLACKNHPSIDVPTRWNSTYLMLESSLPFRAAFEALKVADKDYEFAPSASQWEMAEAICHLLGAFYTATKKISGRTYPTSHLYFYEVWNVKQVMEKEVLNENPTIVAMVKEMEKKWIKYFEESFLTSCVPVIFDPRYKYEYVDFRLTTAFGGGAEKYLTKVKNAMRILFAEYASEFGNTSDEGDELAEEDGEGTLDDWDKHLRMKRSHNSNELQRYLEEDLFPRRQKLDILKWWEIHSPKYPVLMAIAQDILALSTSTVPAEAAFSNAGRIVTDQRSSLTPSTVETLMCLEDWLRAADRQKAEPTAGDYGGDQDDAGTT